MSLPPRKRVTPEPTSLVDTKKTRILASKNPEAQKNGSVFEIYVEMDDSFHVYPKQLREMVEERHKALIVQILAKFETGLPFQPRYNYTITRKRVSQPRDKTSDYEAPRKKTYPAVSFANKEALKEFLVKAPARKAKFVELKLPDGMQPMSNPDFAQLQSVRPDEMGWGMDKDGCLSLHVTTMENGRLRHESIFVERKAVEANKVEEDDECRIVEGPNATEA